MGYGHRCYLKHVDALLNGRYLDYITKGRKGLLAGALFIGE